MIVIPRQPLHRHHIQLMADITDCNNQIIPRVLEEDCEPDLVEQQLELQGDMEQMCEELATLEEVMALKWAVDCDCFYTGENHQ